LRTFPELVQWQWVAVVANWTSYFTRKAA
jgi:hypothetical protein